MVQPLNSTIFALKRSLHVNSSPQSFFFLFEMELLVFISPRWTLTVSQWLDMSRPALQQHAASLSPVSAGTFCSTRRLPYQISTLCFDYMLAHLSEALVLLIFEAGFPRQHSKCWQRPRQINRGSVCAFCLIIFLLVSIRPQCEVRTEVWKSCVWSVRDTFWGVDYNSESVWTCSG